MKSLLFQRMGQIVQYAVPICSTNLLAIAALFFVTMMLAQLGKTELAAFAIANVCNITVAAFLNSCLYSTSILIGQHRAGKDNLAVASLMWNSVWLSIFLGLVGACLLWFMDKFLLLIGEPKVLVDSTVIYFHFAALSMIPMLLGSAVAQIYNGLGRPFISTIIIGLRLPVTLYFCYELILGHYHLGLAGASLGMLMAQVISLLIVIIYMRFSSVWSYFQLKVQRWDLSKIKQLFNIGIHIGLQFLGELTAISGATFLLGYLGDVALASSQIVSQYAIPFVMIILGVSQALSIRVSEAVGRKEYDAVYSYTHAAFWMVTGMLVLFSVVYSIMPSELMSFFINIDDPNNQGLIHLTHWFLVILMPTLFFDGIKNVLTGTLRGLKNVKAPMIIGTLSLWFVGLPACYILGIVCQEGPIGLRLGFSFGYVTGALILWFYYRKFKTMIGATSNLA